MQTSNDENTRNDSATDNLDDSLTSNTITAGKKKVEVIVTDMVTGEVQSMELVTEEAVEVERQNTDPQPISLSDYPLRVFAREIPQILSMTFKITKIVTDEEGVYLRIRTGDSPEPSMSHFYRRGTPL